MIIVLKQQVNTADLSGSMTDISFLLIIFFLVSAVFIADAGLMLSLPKENTKPRELKPEEVVEISVHGTDAYRVEGERVGGLRLVQLIRQRVAASPRRDVIAILHAEDTVVYQTILDTLALARKGGIQIFSIDIGSAEPIPLEVGSEYDHRD